MAALAAPGKPVTELPVTLQLGILLARIRQEGGAMQVGCGLQVGCFGAAAIGDTAHVNQVGLTPALEKTLFPDNLC
jgi:hypothetical protein